MGPLSWAVDKKIPEGFVASGIFFIFAVLNFSSVRTFGASHVHFLLIQHNLPFIRLCSKYWPKLDFTYG